MLFGYRSYTADAGNKDLSSALGRSFTANSGNKVVVLQGINRCGSFLLLSAPHSEKIPGAPAWRWVERIWLTGPSGFHHKGYISVPSGFLTRSQSLFAPYRPI